MPSPLGLFRTSASAPSQTCVEPPVPISSQVMAPFCNTSLNVSVLPGDCVTMRFYLRAVGSPGSLQTLVVSFDRTDETPVNGLMYDPENEFEEM